MKFVTALLGLGALAGAALFAVKAVEKLNDKYDEEEWTATLGDFPEDENLDGGFSEDAQADPYDAPVVYPAYDAADAVPNANPVDAPAPNGAAGEGPLDPTKIACAEDFQNWDELGCQS